MKRRSFVKTSIISSILPGAASASMLAENKKEKRQYYELRVYTLKDESQQALIENYFEKAAIPALNRIGIKNIGVFKELKPQGQTKMYVLIPFESMEDFVQAENKLAADAVYQQAGVNYLQAPATAPAYDRIESSLLFAFEHMPVLAIPQQGNRIFELRRYESASETAGKTKIKVFNEGGEIDIFKSVGLTPVFFGETIIGGLRPNLTYMLTYPDMAAHDASWKKFVNDPRWLAIKAVPDYADAKIVSHITNTFLVPASCSQI
ncbi:MAG: NIPSNAP family protein [Chitinophagaceae bacterium]